jgi:hypothetical protein
MQDLLHYKTNCTYKTADATRANRAGRVHAVVGRVREARLPIYPRLYGFANSLCDLR